MSSWNHGYVGWYRMNGAKGDVVTSHLSEYKMYLSAMTQMREHPAPVHCSILATTLPAVGENFH
jgi:hypothetical protein